MRMRVKKFERSNFRAIAIIENQRMTMAIESMLELLAGCTMRTGATESQIASLQRWAATELPSPYLDLLGKTNGVEGFVMDNSYLILWPAEDVRKNNEGYSVDEFAPGLMLIGSNGGVTAYGFDTRRRTGEIIEVPFIGMSLDEVRAAGKDLEDFLRRIGSEQE